MYYVRTSTYSYIMYIKGLYYMYFKIHVMYFRRQLGNLVRVTMHKSNNESYKIE